MVRSLGGDECCFLCCVCLACLLDCVLMQGPDDIKCALPWAKLLVFEVMLPGKAAWSSVTYSTKISLCYHPHPQ